MTDMMISVGGKPFRCACGCNVFRAVPWRDGTYACNGCGAWFKGSARKADDGGAA